MEMPNPAQIANVPPGISPILRGSNFQQIYCVMKAMLVPNATMYYQYETLQGAPFWCQSRKLNGKKHKFVHIDEESPHYQRFWKELEENFNPTMPMMGMPPGSVALVDLSLVIIDTPVDITNRMPYGICRNLLTILDPNLQFLFYATQPFVVYDPPPMPIPSLKEQAEEMLKDVFGEE